MPLAAATTPTKFMGHRSDQQAESLLTDLEAARLNIDNLARRIEVLEAENVKHFMIRRRIDMLEDNMEHFTSVWVPWVTSLHEWFCAMPPLCPRRNDAHDPSVSGVGRAVSPAQ